MSIVDFCVKCIDRVFGERYGEKIKMALNVLCHEWHMAPISLNGFQEFQDMTDEEVCAAFAGLDQESLKACRDYVKYRRDFSFFDQNYRHFFFNYLQFIGPEDLQERRRMEKAYRRERRRYRTLPGVELGYYESIVSHHGLAKCPDGVKAHLAGGVILDVGACFGDSTLVFLKNYSPARVVAFEPGEGNRKVFRDIMRLNHISEAQYELVPLGLGKAEARFHYQETVGGSNSLRGNPPTAATQDETEIAVTTLDAFCQETALTDIRLVKADIEGMGLDFILGAEKTIRRERPVLSLSIYHNREELEGIYSTLKSWGLGYKFTARMLNFPLRIEELTLIGYPKELG